ncbi:centrosomal protein of 135 kDa [Latimeria chalumnae]|uniref:centrosomal protein of 135 kDa n=1 Tax=Latimeria chalumnae TaxID=7897 RepID=UPI0006D90A71|nr:PREDICTED: restin homolog [Latimeria chalumnae]|eukprot:XP_014343592.1 PREDICTED: restin homolog [Latimeria chalumnae]
MTAKQRRGKGTSLKTEGNSSNRQEGASNADRGGSTALWLFMLLVLGAGGLGGWFLYQQTEKIENLEKTITSLMEKLHNLDSLKDQIRDVNKKVSSIAEYEQRLTNLESAQAAANLTLGKTASSLEQLLANDPINKMSTFQSEIAQHLLNITDNFTPKTDLDQLRDTIELLRTKELEKVHEEIERIRTSGSNLEDGVISISSSLSSLSSKVDLLQESNQDSQALQQKLEEFQVAHKKLESSIQFLLNGSVSLKGQVDQTTKLIDALKSQLQDISKQLVDLKEIMVTQETHHSNSIQQLANLRALWQQMQKEKGLLEEALNSIKHDVADQRRELEGKITELGTVIETIRNQLSQVEKEEVNRNIQVSSIVEGELQTLREKLVTMETALGGTMQQCLSGEVAVHCETPEDCTWPHLSEVTFSHAMPKKPAIMLGLSEVFTQSHTGVSVKATDVTDSGFKVWISNVGDGALNSARVTWMGCA